MEAWTTVRYLHSQGKGKKAIARELGLGRNTVRRALAREGPPSYRRARRPNRQLEPFKEEIRRMRGQSLIGTRILRELRQKGYNGSQSALYNYLHTLKKEEPDPRVSLRYETAPGQQEQFDWSPYTVDLGGELARVVVFASLLGYSRREHFSPSLDARQDSIYSAVEDGFQHFRGAPKQLLVDNDRSFVVNTRPGHFEWNRHFLELCGHYSVQPIACRVGAPRGKGKVENPFRHLEEQFIKGGHWRDFTHFCEELARFESEELDVRIHSTTQQAPLERFQEEAAFLTPLPRNRFVSMQEEMRKVSWDGLVPFRGNKYGVPTAHSGKRVWVRSVRGHTLQIHNQKGEMVASHVLRAGKGAIVLLKGQYNGLRQPRTRTMLRQAFLEQFPDHQVFLEKLQAQQRLNPETHLRAILELAQLYPREALENSFHLAETYNTFSRDFIRGLVERHAPREAPLPGTPLSLRPVPEVRVQGELGVYQQLLAARR